MGLLGLKREWLGTRPGLSSLVEAQLCLHRLDDPSQPLLLELQPSHSYSGTVKTGPTGLRDSVIRRNPHVVRGVLKLAVVVQMPTIITASKITVIRQLSVS